MNRTFVVIAAAAGLSSAAAAQGRLVDVRTLSSGVVFETWRFQDVRPGAGGGMVADATQFTVPATAVVPITANWALDAYVAYASGSTTVDRGGSTGRQTLSVAGVNDAKLRLVGKLHGDNLMLTLGGSIPSGVTALDPEQLDALSVLAAPSLRFRTPALGNGPSATSGLVVAGQAGGWSLALAGSYEMRGSYAPAEALSAGVARPALRAGNAVRLSFGADRAVDATRETFNLIADFYTDGELRDAEAGAAQVGFRLGPSLTAAYQFQATTGSVESTIFLVQRARMNYSLAGETVPGSWRSETEGGTMVAAPMTPRMSLRVGLDGRFHTASRAASTDNSLATFASAGIVSGGLTLALRSMLAGGALALEPFVRAQRGTLDLGGPTRRAAGLGGGLTLSVGF